MANDSTDTDSLNSHLRISSWRGVVFPGWLFIAVSIALLSLLVLSGFLAVISVTYLDSAIDSDPSELDRTPDRIWAFLTTVAMIWAFLNLNWSRQADRAGDESEDARKPIAVYGHLAMAIGCGLIAIGIYSVQLAQSFGTQPIVMDYSDRGRSVIDTNEPAAAGHTGDPVEGRKVFSTVCITCHGASGGGLPNLAPSLKVSAFIESADDSAIANVIRLGRPPTDPANKTKKVMPARGGNPFLTEESIVHLVAFIREIQNETSDVVGEAQDPNAPPPIQLAKWVLPPAPAPPIGMVSLDKRDDVGDEDSVKSRRQRRRTGLVRAFTLGMVGIHCLFLVGVMITSSNVVIRELVDGGQSVGQTLWRWSTLGWGVAVAVWLAIFVFGYVMN